MFNNLTRSQRQQLNKIGKALLLILVVVGIWYVFIYRDQDSSTDTSASTSSGTTEVAPPVATAAVSQTFEIPLTDANGEELANLEYTIEDIDIRKEILVKGTKATAVDGRAFMIVNLKISNKSEQGVNVNTRNYLRLSINGNQDEWFAPDIHNDPVEVQAISTKTTRVGFPINETDTDLIIQFGDIDGEKQQIPINFN